MAKKQIVRVMGDIREHPRYSIEEAAAYLRIPTSTMAAWVRGQRYTTKHGRERFFQAVLAPADPRRNLLSFYNLAEAHVLRATRDRKVPLRNVRRALDYIREQFPANSHPLLTHEFLTSGKEVFIEHLGQTVNATKHGQLAMREILDRYLKRIERDSCGMPIQINPMHSRYLAINPLFSSGRPILKGTGITVAVLRDRSQGGESISDLLGDYGLRLGAGEIRKAIKELAAA